MIALLPPTVAAGAGQPLVGNKTRRIGCVSTHDHIHIYYLAAFENYIASTICCCVKSTTSWYLQ
jgi:hypothetical protein